MISRSLSEMDEHFCPAKEDRNGFWLMRSVSALMVIECGISWFIVPNWTSMAAGMAYCVSLVVTFLPLRRADLLWAVTCLIGLVLVFGTTWGERGEEVRWPSSLRPIFVGASRESAE